MKTSIKFPDSVEDFCIACVPVGSRVTCNPPPTDTDQDILCLVDDEELEDFYQWIEKHGWDYEGDEKYQPSEFASYRKGEFNLIITAAPNWFDAFMDATRECKEKNLLTKEARIEVFEKYIPQKKKTKPSIGNKLQAILAMQNTINQQAGSFVGSWSVAQSSLWGTDGEPLPGNSMSDSLGML